MEAKIARSCVARSLARIWRGHVTRSAAVFITVILSCTEVSVTAVDVAQISVQPPTLNLAVGETGQLTAVLRDAGGNVLNGRSVTWSSSNSSAVTVGSDGSVIALAAGEATIRASAEGEQGEAVVNVAPPPLIDVEPATATFRVPAGSPAPPPIDIAIRNDGPGSLGNLTTSVSYNAGEPGGWLTATLAAATAPTTLTLRAVPGTLGRGIYTAAVTVSTTSSVPSSQTITVVLEITEANPSIALDATDVSFTAIENGANPADRTVAVTNGGGGLLGGLGVSIGYDSGQPTGWLDANLSSATAPATLTLSAQTGSLPVGTYTATVSIASGVAANSPRLIDVAFTVTATPPTLVLAPTSVIMAASAGGVNPAPQTVTVSNGGPGTLTGLTATVNYPSGGSSGWLVANLNGTSTPAAIMLAADIGTLSVGVHSATVVVTSTNATNSPQSVTVSLTVNPTVAVPDIALSPTDLSFNATAGGADPSSQTIDITNGGTGTLNGLATSVTYASGQPSGWLNTILSGTTAPATITAQPVTGTLAAGTYNATIEVASPAAANSPQAVNVTFTVAPAPVPPAIGLSRATASFAATAGAANPASQTVNVANTGGGTLNGLTASVTYGSGQPAGWLSASLSGTSAPSTITLQAATGSLAAGTYNATVSVAASVASNSPQTIAVTFTVTAAPVPPAIGLSQSAISFNATAGGANPSNQTVSVTNTGGQSLSGLATSVTYASGQPTGWLTASLGGTTAPATITLRAVTGSLVAGTYDATVSVTSGVASNSPQTINVTFTVAAAPVPPAISLSRSDVAFNATAGGANPANETLNVTNSGGGTLSGLATSITYAAGQPNGWLSASLSATTAPATVTLQASTGSLPAGTYRATVQVSSGVASNSPRTVNVTFVVAAAPVPPAISLSQTSISFNATAGGANPSNQTVNVTNTGGGSLTGLATSVTYATGQPTGWLTASLSGTTAPATISLQAATGSLAAGTYTATVSVTSGVASNSPQTIAVTFTVAAAPVPPGIGLSQSSISFNATEGGANPSNQTVSITNTGGGSLTGLAASVTYGSGSSGWLTVSLSGTSAPSTLTLQAAPASLSDGTYDATVTITSSAASNSPQTIAVTFTVDPAAGQPVIDLGQNNITFNATAGGNDPNGQDVTVTNGGSGTLSGLATSITYSSGQPTGWLTATLGGTSAPAMIALRATTGSLAPGTYNAAVSVTSPVASNSPQTIAITFQIANVPPPAAPTNLNANGRGNMIHLTWNDNSNDETRFEVHRNNTGSSGPWITIATLPANSIDYHDRNYVSGVTYWYRVLACNAGGCASSNVDTGSN